VTTSRYPGEYEPVEEKDYLEALKLANDVFNWTLEIIK
jgi:hypothetical protein